MTAVALKAPFPYFGGKSRVAKLVWERLGEIKHYIEPFCGSAAMLLSREVPCKSELVNDADCFIANFWRAVQADPDAVVTHCDQPVNEADLHAWNNYFINSDDAKRFRERIRTEPDYFDARIAGRWVWGKAAWIGRGWCKDTHKQLPAINVMGVHTRRNADLMEWFTRLAHRLRYVKVCCGDWNRVCCSRSTTTHNGLTGVFLDPPYLGDASGKKSRDSKLYATEDLSIAHEVREWCIARESDPLMRIALCGYVGEHDELEHRGWDVVAWKAQGGYGNQGGNNTNAQRERIWFSPHCLKPDNSQDGNTP